MIDPKAGVGWAFDIEHFEHRGITVESLAEGIKEAALADPAIGREMQTKGLQCFLHLLLHTVHRW